jgi:hypothetical protein
VTRVEGSQLLYTAGGRSAYLPDGREVTVVVTTEDGSIGVLTDHDRWYVATLHTVSGTTTATVLKAHGGKPYAYRDAERLAASRRDMPAATSQPPGDPFVELRSFEVPNLPPKQPQTQSAAMDAAMAGIMAERFANMRTTTKEQDQGVARKAPFIIAAVVVLALVTPPILLVVWVPAVIFLALAWLGARSDG